MAYTMIAERDSLKIRKQRESALIVLANAKVMESEGWQVVITDEDGKSLPLAEFEAGMSQRFSSWYKPTSRPVVPTTVPAPNMFGPSEAQTETEAEAIVAAELAAEAEETAGSEIQQVDEDDFETAETANTADNEKAAVAEHDEGALGTAEMAH